MQDIYLFRGKSLVNGEWVYGSYIEETNGHFIIVKRGHWIEVDPTTVGKCIGLHAAKSYRGESERDKLVFEGDIVKGYRNYIAKVVWGDTGFERYGDNGYCALKAKEQEIIGNIHEHSALLGE